MCVRGKKDRMASKGMMSGIAGEGSRRVGEGSTRVTGIGRSIEEIKGFENV